jgi:formate transporter
MEPVTTDAYAPPDIAQKIAQVAGKKSALDFFRLFVLAVMAGVFISFGAEFYTVVTHDSGLAFGLNSLVGGLVFCLGLILVVVAGAELFTGNSLMVMGFVDGIIGARGLLRNWGIVYLGNFVGCILMVLLMYASGQMDAHGGMIGAKALLIANGKVNLSFFEAFTRGMLCNVLVVLAIWLCFSARSTTDKIFAIVFPITAFVASGFEHCVANMYFVPLGIILKGQQSIVEAAGVMAGSAPDLSNLGWSSFLLHNLIPVTIGNVIGGGLLVGLVYWSIYLREFSFKSVVAMGQIGFKLVFFVQPRQLSPSKLAATISSFFGILSRKPSQRSPVPRDLTTLVDDDEEEV